MLWPVLPVAAPLFMAAFLAAVARLLPPTLAFWFALVTTLGIAVDCGWLLLQTWSDPIVYWFGGWQPRGSAVLGISFVVEPLGAGLSILVSLLVAAAFVFSAKYFDTARTHYHVLMLVFLGAMCGFSLTGDLFNLFVFFELMSISAFVLCGYKSEEPGPLQGALNFAITNTIGACWWCQALPCYMAGLVRSACVLGAMMCFAQRHIK
jgi:multicomponent Na+:H+ antiporter subunit D